MGFDFAALRPEVRAAGSSDKGNPLGKSELHFST